MEIFDQVVTLTFIYISRYRKLHPSACLPYWSTIISLMLAHKCVYSLARPSIVSVLTLIDLLDEAYSNQVWSQLSGIDLEHLMLGEITFLSRIQYDLSVSDTEWNIWAYWAYGARHNITVGSYSQAARAA
jgi:hypothetical protein